MTAGAAVVASTGNLRPEDEPSLDEIGTDEELDEDEVGKDGGGRVESKPSPAAVVEEALVV